MPLPNLNREIKILLVHGNWSDWTTWTKCTLECGNGTQIRGRSCTSPRAQYGGKDCEGHITEVGHCNIDPCPSKFNICFSI